MRLVCAWCGAALIYLSQNELQLSDVVLDSEALCFGGFDADVQYFKTRVKRKKLISVSPVRAVSVWAVATQVTRFV